MAENLGIPAENVRSEKVSGRRGAAHAELDRLMGELAAGDELYVESFSRLSRSLPDLLSTCEALDAGGVALISLKEGEADTRTATGRLFFAVAAAFAQYEREISAERRAEGQRAKRERDGRCGGRPKADQSKIDAALALRETSDMSVSEICAAVGISRSTFYKYAQEMR